MLPLKRILVATDFSAVSDAAVDYAVELARPFRATVTLVHVHGVALDETLAHAANGCLARAVDARQGCGVEVTSVMREGTPGEEIIDVADGIDADMVIVGTHARRDIERVPLPSLAERLVRSSTRPVLTVRRTFVKEEAGETSSDSRCSGVRVLGLVEDDDGIHQRCV